MGRRGTSKRTESLQDDRVSLVGTEDRVRAERTVSVPRDECVNRPGVGGRRKTGDFCWSRTLGALAVGDRTWTYPVTFLSE